MQYQHQHQQHQQQSNGFGFNPDLSPALSHAAPGAPNGGSPFLGSNGSSSVAGGGQGAFSFNPSAGAAGLGLGAVGGPGGSVGGGPGAGGPQQQIQAQILAMQQQQLMAGMGMMGGMGAVVSELLQMRQRSEWILTPIVTCFPLATLRTADGPAAHGGHEPGSDDRQLRSVESSSLCGDSERN